jgi:hypothetical protein
MKTKVYYFDLSDKGIMLGAIKVLMDIRNGGGFIEN